MQRINYKHKPHCVRAFLRYQLQNASPKATCCCGCWLWPSLSLVFYWIHTHIYIKFKRLTPICSLDEVSRNNVLVQHTARYIIYGFCAWFSELPVLMKQFVSHQWTKLLCLGVKKKTQFYFFPQYLSLYKWGKEHSPPFWVWENQDYLTARFQSPQPSMNTTIVTYISVPNARVTLLLEISSLCIAPPNKYQVYFFKA